ncbi:ferredoxin [Streptosporangium subroseum]|uniref:ferredoxin n=1 Tax=Streptosporangium subroseum TaxID=106412 RepID=UPI00343B6E29
MSSDDRQASAPEFVRVRRDPSACYGHALCNAQAPQVYPIDEEGFSTVTEKLVPPDLAELAKRGADACPESAIRLE